MIFEKGYIYYIYNQGNLDQKVFFNRYDYFFFLDKIKIHLLPFVDILAWCLIPTQFDIMVKVNKTELPIIDHIATISEESSKIRSLNYSIATMLRAYTISINKAHNLKDTLFKKRTQAECLNNPKSEMPSFLDENDINKIHIKNPVKEIPQICFDYIHQKPVISSLVKKETDWEFSSAKDYAGMRHVQLINKKLADKLKIQY